MKNVIMTSSKWVQRLVMGFLPFYLFTFKCEGSAASVL